MTSRPRNGRVVELRGAHHYLFMSNEAEAMRELTAFLLESTARRPGQ